MCSNLRLQFVSVLLLQVPVTPQLLYTSLILIALVLVLAREVLETEVALFGALVLLMLGGVISPEEAFRGFSNVGVLSIGLLFVVAGGLYQTGALEVLYPLLFGNGRPRGVRRQLVRLVFPIAAVSAFTNNTPLVAMLIPAVRSWTEKHGLSPSKFLIPVSYAAILGGMCTLIGTSTILIVHGLLIENGQPGFGFFEVTTVGVPVAAVGLLFLILAGPRLLPDRKEPLVELGERVREFVIELKVTPEYRNIGKTIEEAGLRHLKGLFLFQIERNGEVIAPAGPDERILEGDRLFFTGLPKTILELQKTPGLQLVKDSSFDLKQYDSDKVQTFEAVVSQSSPLVGKNVRESNFRAKYGAVIIAIHRNGERIRSKIGDVVLRPGDTLLLLADKDFMKRWYYSDDFYLISSSVVVPSKPRWQAYLAGGIFVAMVVLAVTKVIPLVAAASGAALLMVLSGSISRAEARRAIDWRVLIAIASAFGIAAAIRNSGLADLLGKGIAHLQQTFGTFGAVVGVYGITSLANTVITSNATAALVFPVAISTALLSGVALRPFAILVAVAAAASFATPISYQTNLMVYGPGGYRFGDYLRIGVPMQVLTGLVAVTVVSLLYG